MKPPFEEASHTLPVPGSSVPGCRKCGLTLARLPSPPPPAQLRRAQQARSPPPPPGHGALRYEEVAVEGFAWGEAAAESSCPLPAVFGDGGREEGWRQARGPPLHSTPRVCHSPKDPSALIHSLRPLHERPSTITAAAEGEGNTMSRVVRARPPLRPRSSRRRSAPRAARGSRHTPSGYSPRSRPCAKPERRGIRRA